MASKLPKEAAIMFEGGSFAATIRLVQQHEFGDTVPVLAARDEVCRWVGEQQAHCVELACLNSVQECGVAVVIYAHHHVRLVRRRVVDHSVQLSRPSTKHERVSTCVISALQHGCWVGRRVAEQQAHDVQSACRSSLPEGCGASIGGDGCSNLQRHDGVWDRVGRSRRVVGLLLHMRAYGFSLRLPQGVLSLQQSLPRCPASALHTISHHSDA
jgi:hypothetical protein